MTHVVEDTCSVAVPASGLATVARTLCRATVEVQRVPDKDQRYVRFNDHVEFLDATLSTAARRRRRRTAAAKTKLAALTAAPLLSLLAVQTRC